MSCTRRTIVPMRPVVESRTGVGTRRSEEEEGRGGGGGGQVAKKEEGETGDK